MGLGAPAPGAPPLVVLVLRELGFVRAWAHGGHGGLVARSSAATARNEGGRLPHPATKRVRALGAGWGDGLKGATRNFWVEAGRQSVG